MPTPEQTLLQTTPMRLRRLGTGYFFDEDEQIVPREIPKDDLVYERYLNRNGELAVRLVPKALYTPFKQTLMDLGITEIAAERGAGEEVEFNVPDNDSAVAASETARAQREAKSQREADKDVEAMNFNPVFTGAPEVVDATNAARSMSVDELRAFHEAQVRAVAGDLYTDEEIPDRDEATRKVPARDEEGHAQAAELARQRQELAKEREEREAFLAGGAAEAMELELPLGYI